MKKAQDCCDECPKAGDVYVCDQCKMTVVVEKDCGCADNQCVSLVCCGQKLCKKN